MCIVHLTRIVGREHPQPAIFRRDQTRLRRSFQRGGQSLRKDRVNEKIVAIRGIEKRDSRHYHDREKHKKGVTIETNMFYFDATNKLIFYSVWLR